MPDSIKIPTVLETFFAQFECAPKGSQRIIRNISVPGQNGVALMKGEKRAEPFNGTSVVWVPTTLYVADNAALTRQLYDELVGEIVTIDLQGVEYADICVLSVMCRPHSPLVATMFGVQPDGTEINADAYEVTADWEFVYAGTVA
jgi:hypothetical protein